MIRKRRWPDLLLPLAVPVLAGGFMSLLLVLAVPVERTPRVPYAVPPQPAITEISLPEHIVRAGRAVVEADPFAGDRKAPPRRGLTAANGRQAAIGGRMPAAANRLALVGLLTDPSGPIVVLRNETSGETALLRKGETFHGLKVTAVDGLSVRLEGTDGKAVMLTLSFRKGDGTGTTVMPRTVPRTQPRARRPHPVTGGRSTRRTVRPATAGAAAPRRDGFGGPKPARRFRARKENVRTWQRKLEDYGIADDRHRRIPPADEQVPPSGKEPNPSR